ncbi:MAG: zinc ribbon domain-containing protein [Planctomycetes bacterium]|nr:zinc ribbon domain-containing protein [Planctomycetota bacterium]
MYYGWIDSYYSHRSSVQAAHSASDANNAARRAENALARLEDALDRQALIIRTLLTACEKAGIFNEDQFRELVTEVDLSDGRLDGKYKPQQGPQGCPNCGKTNGKRAMKCMYCGAVLEPRDIM